MAGQGKILPVSAKMKVILNFPVPEQRLVGLVGYKKLCHNLSTIINLLTNLQSPKVKFQWTQGCQESFEKLKRILSNSPLPVAVNYEKEFKLYVDSSDTGTGASLMQEDDNGVEHPVSYYSKNLNCYQRSSSHNVIADALSRT